MTDKTEIDVWEKIIYYLQGSCDSLDKALEAFDREDL